MSGEAEADSSLADSIAARLIGFLVNAFEEKHHRQPASDEIEAMLEELDEERVAELMGGNAVKEDGSVDGKCEKEEERDEDEESEVGDGEEGLDVESDKRASTVQSAVRREDDVGAGVKENAPNVLATRKEVCVDAEASASAVKRARHAL